MKSVQSPVETDDLRGLFSPGFIQYGNDIHVSLVIAACGLANINKTKSLEFHPTTSLSRMQNKLPIVTTNPEIYKNPRHLPGYTGHVHQENFQYGETYGNKTARLLSEYRTTKLQDSTLGVNGRGGDAQIPFPTYYDHDPSRVIGTRPRTWERWQPQHKYDLLNSSSREGEIRDFNKAAQQHREQYKDHSGTRRPVDVFVQPNISYPTTPTTQR